MVLHGVTRSCMLLHSVTGCCTVLHSVTCTGQRAKKVVDSVLTLPDGEVKLFEEFEKQKN